MNSLLQHLQKARARHHLRDDMVVIKQNPSDSLSLRSLASVDQDIKEMELLLDKKFSTTDLASSTPFVDNFLDLPMPQELSITKEHTKLDGTSVTVLKRKSGTTSINSSITNKTKSEPWWLQSDSSITVRDELLISATSELAKIFSTEKHSINLINTVANVVKKVTNQLKDTEEINQKECDNAQVEILKLITAKGPLKTLFEDLEVTDIFIDSHKSISAIRSGKAFETPFSFRSKDEYQLFIWGLLRNTNKTLSTENKVIDLVLDDNWSSHLNLIDSSLTDGNEPKLVIHIPRKQSISFYDILQTKVVPPLLAAWLSELSASRSANILITGPARSGKTMIAAALLSAVGTDERVITIEDSPEIIVSTAQIEKLLTNTSSSKTIDKTELLNIALKRNAHRIVLGSIQGKEINKFLQILEMGYKGCLTTITAESALDALWIIHDIILDSKRNISESIKRKITRSFNIIISMGLVNEKPCLIEINEVIKSSGEDFKVIPLIKFHGYNGEQRQWQILKSASYWLNLLAAKGMQLTPGPGLIGVDSE